MTCTLKRLWTVKELAPTLGRVTPDERAPNAEIVPKSRDAAELAFPPKLTPPEFESNIRAIPDLLISVALMYPVAVICPQTRSGQTSKASMAGKQRARRMERNL